MNFKHPLSGLVMVVLGFIIILLLKGYYNFLIEIFRAIGFTIGMILVIIGALIFMVNFFDFFD